MKVTGLAEWSDNRTESIVPLIKQIAPPIAQTDSNEAKGGSNHTNATTEAEQSPTNRPPTVEFRSITYVSPQPNAIQSLKGLGNAIR